MKDDVYDKIVTRWEEIVELPPQQVGRFTGLYKKITSKLKVMPWPLLFILSVCIVLFIFFVFGPATLYLVELIQRGF